MTDIDVYVEAGSKRAFAGALDWPGWCRSARDEAGALEALAAYRSRYARAIGRSFTVPSDPAFRVVERVAGDATTDFGAPSGVLKSDRRPLGEDELERRIAVLRACWRALDRTARAHAGVPLAKGPRGGGREVDAIAAHAREAAKAYLVRLGGTSRGLGDDGARVRSIFVDLLRARARGEPVDGKARTMWPPRMAVRREAWHALDHAWEIEDRAQA